MKNGVYPLTNSKTRQKTKVLNVWDHASLPIKKINR